jgi:hypothetical protein
MRPALENVCVILWVSEDLVNPFSLMCHVWRSLMNPLRGVQSLVQSSSHGFLELEISQVESFVPPVSVWYFPAFISRSFRVLSLGFQFWWHSPVYLRISRFLDEDSLSFCVCCFLTRRSFVHKQFSMQRGKKQSDISISDVHVATLVSIR